MTQEHLSWLRKYLEGLYQTPILENFLGLELVGLSEGNAELTAKIKDMHSNIYGFTHGGTLASFADVAMGISCVTYAKRIITIDMSVSYIKNVTAGSIITVKGSVISNGNTIMRAVGEIYSDEQLLARSQASYFVIGNFTEDDHPQNING